MLKCTFAGHRQVYLKDAEQRIEKVVAEFSEQHSDIYFYCGGMGEFDYLCSKAVKKVKILNPDKKIKLFLIAPYMMQRINREREDLRWIYDEIIIPDELSDCYYKKAITARNRWMVDHCDFIITHVVRPYGGAWNTFRYAQEKGLYVLNIKDD